MSTKTIYHKNQSRLLSHVPEIKPQLSALSENSLLVQLHAGISSHANRCIQHLAKLLKENALPGQQEVLPAYDSLLIVFKINFLGNIHDVMPEVGWLVEKALSVAETEEHLSGSAIITIPVCYDPLLRNDLAEMGNQTGLSTNEIMQIHLSRTYQVFMLGFLPGFAYMGEVDPRIALSRKPEPMPVKAGAVGIAGKQTGIYPLGSPGGWNIVGYTPCRMFNASQTHPTLLQPGNEVRFESISLSEFKTMKHHEHLD